MGACENCNECGRGIKSNFENWKQFSNHSAAGDGVSQIKAAQLKWNGLFSLLAAAPPDAWHCTYGRSRPTVPEPIPPAVKKTKKHETREKNAYKKRHLARTDNVISMRAFKLLPASQASKPQVLKQNTGTTKTKRKRAFNGKRHGKETLIKCIPWFFSFFFISIWSVLCVIHHVPATVRLPPSDYYYHPQYYWWLCCCQHHWFSTKLHSVRNNQINTTHSVKATQWCMYVSIDPQNHAAV